jgi:hypothetical protein
VRSGPSSHIQPRCLFNIEHRELWRIVLATAIPAVEDTPMATMPGANEQERARSDNPQAEPKHSRPAAGAHPPGTQQPQNWAQGPGGTQQPYEPIEPKHRADEASGRQEPSAHPQRAPEHQPGYEAKHQKEAKGQKHQDDAHHRSQADDAAAEREARDDEDTLHRQKGQRAHTAARKSET